MVKKDRAEAVEYVLKMTKEHDIKFVNLWFTDILLSLIHI